MIYNYCKTAWRNLAKHKVFSFINIFGLAAGMTVCMLAMIKIKEAYDYDTFHPNAASTFRILTSLDKKNGEHFLCASTPFPLAGYLKDNYKVVNKSARICFFQYPVTVRDNRFSAKEAFVDADFYDIFGFKLASGTASLQPKTVVLTSETAGCFFGKNDPVGQTITLGDSIPFLVTGVLAKPPYPSHLKFDLLAGSTSISTLKHDEMMDDWTNEAAAYTYVQLTTGSKGSLLQQIVKDVSKKANNITIPLGKKMRFDIQPLNQISPGRLPLSNITAEPIFPNLLVFALIGLSMLLLAFFNYINLTLSRALDRAKEVGIRKVAGAGRSQLVIQFLSESVLIAIFAFALAYLQLKWLSELPAVRRIIGEARQDRLLWLYFAVFTVVTGMLAGWIPARVLSAFQPVRVLKGKFNTRLFGGVGLRKTLTVIQFTTSLIAIVTLVVFYRQSVFMATADYGFARQHILNLRLPAHAYARTAAAFSAVSGVEEVAASSGLFGFSEYDNRFIRREKTGDSLRAAYFSVTASFLQNMGIRLVAGEFFPPATDQANRFVMINEEAARVLHFTNPADAAGKSIWLNDTSQYIITAVVRDFHYASFLRRIEPLVLVSHPEEYSLVSVKVTPGTEKTILPVLERSWKQLFPTQPFLANWFDQQLYDQHLHKDDLSFLGVLTLMSISIACLGLLGMVMYTTKNRSKEVSIRRVMGAAIGQVMVEVSSEFVLLLLLSVAIGIPAGFITARQFLQQYAYRIPVGAGILAGCAAALLVLGSITIGWQTYHVALTNPAKRLRNE